MRQLINYSLLLLAFSCGADPQPAESRSAEDCMTAIIAQDDSLGRYRNNACKTISLSATISDYANALQALDFQNCPTAFEKAFQGHSDAWSALLPISDKHDALRGEMHDLFDELEQSPDSTVFKTLVAKVWSSWAEVEAAIEE